VFNRASSTWSQQGTKLIATDESGRGEFGTSVALSGDGTTALVGGFADAAESGAAWAFSSKPPLLTSINPVSGPTGGGTLVTIRGSHLAGATAVKFGPTAATLFKIVSDSTINAVSPPAPAGSVEVTVSSLAGASAATSGDRFTYTGTNTRPTTTTTTTTATTTTAKTQPVSRIVYATVLGHGKLRNLDVRIRVSELATAKLQLYAHRFRLFTKTFAVKGGRNELKAPLPFGLKPGTDQLLITLQDANHHQKTYTTSVLVPA
jgi:hypothetical protein